MDQSSASNSPRVSALHNAMFRRIWFGGLLLALGSWSERLTVGWLAISTTGSPFLTAATFAARQAPGILFAPLAGALSDRIPRPLVLLAAVLYKAVMLAGIAWVAFAELDTVWLLVFVALAGIGGTFELPSVQGLISDVMPPTARMNAVAVYSLGIRAVGALGALVGGVGMALVGIPATLLGGAGVSVVGALVIATVTVPRRRVSSPPDGRKVAIFADVAAGLRLMVRTPTVRALLVAAMIVEIFGFAYNALLPTFARDVLGVDEIGLGMMGVAAGLGSVAGVAVLSVLGDFRRKGMLLIGGCLTFGVFMLLFAVTEVFWAALLLMAGIGAAAAAFDALQWTLLQTQVPDAMRGRALSAWVFAIGFGWVGHLGLGAVAEALNVHWALGGAGALLLLTGLGMLVGSPSIRRL